MYRYATNVTKRAWSQRKEDAHFALNITKEEANIIIINISNNQNIINRIHNNNNIILKIHHKDTISNITLHNQKVNI